MPFNYISTGTDQVVFTRLSAGISRFMFLIIGLIFTIIGFCLLYFGQFGEMPFALIPYVVPLFGILGIYMSFAIPKIQRKGIPDEIIFDNKKGRVEVNQKDSEVNTAYIYYDEIADFKIEAKKTQSSSNNTSRTYYSYHVYLLKKDGGQWELLKCGSEADAIIEINRLKTVIDLKAQPQRMIPMLQSSKKYTVNKNYQKLEVSWRNKVGFGGLFLVLFSLVFITIFWFMLDGELNSAYSSAPVFAFFVLGFIGIVFLIVIGSTAMKLIKNAKTVYSLLITNSALIYLEKDNAEHVKKEVRIPFNELKAITFSFDTESSLRKLFIYTHAQFQQKNNIKPSFSLEYIKQLFEFNKGLLALEIQSLTPVEALHLEGFLQHQIKEISGAEVE